MSRFWKNLGDRFVATADLEPTIEKTVVKPTRKQPVKKDGYKEKAIENSKKGQNISPINWFLHTVVSVCLVYAGWGMRNIDGVGFSCMFLSWCFGIVAFKELMAESFCRAMEVYYGKKRAVHPIEPQENTDKKSQNNNRIDFWE